MTRRLFLGLGKALGLLLAAGAALPPALFWWRSARVGKQPERWIDLGLARKIPEGEWLENRFSFERRNRWRQEVTEEMVYLRRDDRRIRILSPVCPHARCLVQTTDDGFACRCHRSFFDADGAVIEGPSPRALDALEWKVERGHLKVKYQEFRPGEREPEVLSG